MKQKRTIGIVDDQILFRQGLLSLMSEYKELNVLFEAANGKELMELLKQKQPEVILLDLEMPVMDGAEATVLIRQKYPKIKIIILTMHNEEGLIVDLLEKGVKGFLTKDTNIEVLVDAIYSVIENEYFFNDNISRAMVRNLMASKKINPYFQNSILTDKEIEIIRLICSEFTNREIADKLCLSPRTIDSHRERILGKIGARNTAGIVMYAIKQKLVD